MTETLVQQVMKLYEHFDHQLLASMDDIYHPDVIFQDPLHRVVGLEALRTYFGQMIQGLEVCSFEFHDAIAQPMDISGGTQANQAVLFWTMRYRHRKLNSGKLLSLAGNSHLRYGDEGVYFHRDYFDAGAMLYEHLPVLGFVIGRIKRRLET